TPRRTLRDLIARHGPGLCSDARRCEGLLRDLCGAHHREINILVAALRERVPLDLLAARNSVPAGLLLTRLSKRLEAQLALTGEAARWAVESWALALGVVSDAELKEIKSRSDEAARPRVEAAPRPANATRPPAEDRPETGQPAPRTSTRPMATPPSTRKSHQPSATRTPAAPTPPAPLPPAAPAQRPRGGSNAPAPQHPARRTPSYPQATSTGGLPEPLNDPTPRGVRGRWRGCLVGCLLLALLSVLLAVGGPFVVNILREEQERRNLEPSPAQTR
ncbi:MAG TPA: hypothetical protein VF621_04520, partial [Pyrinomonadaceae bacterium]